MKIIFLFLGVTIACFSCTQSVTEKNEKNIDSIVKDSVVVLPVDLDGCYVMIISSDSAFMKLEQKNDALFGTLHYKRKEKDSNTGKVILKRIGARAEGYYTFNSEGKTSVRQIIFKIKPNAFAEAYGDIEMRNDTATLKFPHALNYEEKHPFNKVNCN